VHLFLCPDKKIHPTRCEGDFYSVGCKYFESSRDYVTRGVGGDAAEMYFNH